MIYVTGDTHANFERFSMRNFPQQKEMTKDDYVIVCGDFGLWDDSKEERYHLNQLAKRNFTLLFVDGNHSNFDRLYSEEFEIVDFHGGKAHKIRENIYHLMRGYVFELEGKKFFAFGGASSHDIKDGILNPDDFADTKSLVKRYNQMTMTGKLVRINHISWWKEELPDNKEMNLGKENLKKHGYCVDYVITHCPPHQVCSCYGFYDKDSLIDYFEDLENNGFQFKEWWSGHLHKDELNIFGKYNLIYRAFVRIE